MNATTEFRYEPACRAGKGANCSGCKMAFDCQSKREGRMAPWPLVALAVLAAMALLA